MQWLLKIQDLLKTNKCRLGFRKIQKSVLSNLMSKIQKLEKFRSQSFIQSLTPPFKLNICLVFNNWFERFLFMAVCNILYFSFSWLFLFLFGSEPTKHLSWWRRLSSLFSEDVLIKTNIFPIAIRLQKTSSKLRGQNQYIYLGHASSRHLQDVLPSCFQNVFLKSCKSVFKTSCKDVFKTFSRGIIKLICSC